MDLQFLNARQGDAIWVRWGEGHQLMIDMGTAGTGRSLANRIRRLPEEKRAFDLLVVTHIDTDHIGGVLTCVVDPKEPIPGLTFSDVWFNGWEHLHRRVSADGLSITVVAPVQERLTDLIDNWRDDVLVALDRGTLEEVSPGLEAMGPSTPPTLESLVDLELLVDDPSPRDPSKANAAIISLLLERDGRRVLLTGDATASELIGGLALIDGGARVQLDLVKLPHHGSRQNVSSALVKAIDCPLWVFSSDGTTFRHPDAIAVGRVLQHSEGRPRLAFNVPSKFNKWWESSEWIDLFGYDVTYGDADDGTTIASDPRL